MSHYNVPLDGLWIFGTTVYTALVISMFGRIILLTHTWTLYSHGYFWLSLAAYIVFLFLYQVPYKKIPPYVIM